MIGDSITSQMGKIAKETMTSYLGDLVLDGSFLEKFKDKNCFLWFVRAMGTDILSATNNLCLTTLEDIINHNERVFFLEFFIDQETGDRLSWGEVTEFPISEVKNL